MSRENNEIVIKDKNRTWWTQKESNLLYMTFSSGLYAILNGIDGTGLVRLIGGFISSQIFDKAVLTLQKNDILVAINESRVAKKNLLTSDCFFNVYVKVDEVSSILINDETRPNQIINVSFDHCSNWKPWFTQKFSGLCFVLITFATFVIKDNVENIGLRIFGCTSLFLFGIFLVNLIDRKVRYQQMEYVISKINKDPSITEKPIRLKHDSGLPCCRKTSAEEEPIISEPDESSEIIMKLA